jgi:hypothetical protein
MSFIHTVVFFANQRSLIVMGAVYPGIPRSLAAFIQREFNISSFVETGTYMGETADWAAGLFKDVYTIELSETFYKKSVEKYGDRPNIRFLQGSSLSVLSDLLKGNLPISLFWLDAHFSEGGTAGEEIQCPLLDEIRIILKKNARHFIFIDDARQILSYAPESLRVISDLPPFKDVMDALDRFGPRYSVVWRDVLISAPDDCKDSIYKFLKERGDLVFFDSSLDFSREGVGTIARWWKEALKTLPYIPGAIARSIKSRLGG